MGFLPRGLFYQDLRLFLAMRGPLEHSNSSCNRTGVADMEQLSYIRHVFTFNKESHPKRERLCLGFFVVGYGFGNGYVVVLFKMKPHSTHSGLHQ